MMKTGKYTWDRNDWAKIVGHETEEVLADELSHRQWIVIRRLKRYGEMLLLAEPAEKKKRRLWPQLAMGDEYRYHQILVWLALLYHNFPDIVHIYGGGDLLAALRAILCKLVREVYVLDWDLNVKRLMLENILSIAALGVHKNPHVHSSEEVDVREYLLRETKPVPVVIWDLLDMSNLDSFLPNALGLLYNKVEDGGVVSIQGGEYSADEVPLKQMVADYRGLREWFETVLIANVYVGSFNYRQTIYLAFKGRKVEPRTPRKEELKERFALEQDHPFFTPEMHDVALTLDTEIRIALRNEGLI